MNRRVTVAIVLSSCVVSSLLVGLLASSALAAIAPRSSDWKSPAAAPALGVHAIKLDQTLAALGLPFANRIKALRAQGPAGYKNLRAVMFDPKSRIDDRWKATMAVARIGGPLSLPELERAVQADVWELRGAALIAVSRFDRETASKWARIALKDKALLVRLTAVQTLDTIHDRGSVPYLWAQLDSRQNYKGSHSLFIRRRIVEALAKLEGTGSETRFVALLEDEDNKLHVPAIAAIERITGQSFGKPSDQLSKKRALCLQWARKS